MTNLSVEKAQTAEIFELTCPGEHRINTSYKPKSEKYEHFLTDITSFKPSVTPFEIGSNTGFITSRNRTTLKKIHTFCKHNIKLKQFINNISAISILGSYYIFNCRN